ncbi:Vacuole non-autophagic-related protein [Mycena venus]|uniref:Vacuole non-autophagic-related protein n=1 Tax=Mycena venus TaxID=2733690 RepID=A0A8H6XA45_9AGAR|nr:Vacuole non-autophagic-related protein [Mycena venus]
MAAPSPTPRQKNGDNPLAEPRPDSLIRRSWHAMSDMFSPFSSSALASLPNPQRPQRYTRADGIPETEEDSEGQRPIVRDYLSINAVPPLVRVPKKIATPVRVEGKVWFANERTWVAWLNIAVLIGTLALALFNASKDQIARNFAYLYALISVGVMIYGYVLYQHRITKIRKRDPGHFDMILGPVIISGLLFVAILANFMIRDDIEDDIPIMSFGHHDLGTYLVPVLYAENNSVAFEFYHTKRAKYVVS